jgi:sporulation protein YlmC with PRC-barrel domain
MRIASILHPEAVITGYVIQATDGEIGQVGDFLFDDRSGKVRHLVVSLHAPDGVRNALVAPKCVTGVDVEHQLISVALSRKEVEQSHSEEVDPPVSLQKWSSCDYVVCRAPWSGADGTQFPGFPFIVAAEPDPRKPSQPKGDPHLRSAVEVATYAIRALDGWAGLIRGFLVDVEAWVIRDVLVKTRKWLPGRKVLIPWVSSRDVNYDKMEVRVDMTRDRIQQCPKYDLWAPRNIDYGVGVSG